MTKIRFTAVAAMTIDGRIAHQKKPKKPWTSPEDFAHMQKMIREHDVLILGNTTYQEDPQLLAKNHLIIFTRSVDSIVEKSKRLTHFNPEKNNITDFCRQRGYHKVCVFGGSHIYGYFIKNNLLDDLYLTVEPVVFGEGVPLAVADMSDTRLNLVSVDKLNNNGTLLLYYQKK